MMNTNIQTTLNQRSMSAEPPAERLKLTKARRGSATIPIDSDEPVNATCADEVNMTPTAKVSAWLETLSNGQQGDDDDEDDLVQAPTRDPVDIAVTRLGSLHLQPLKSVDLSTLDGQTDTEAFRLLKGKAIPPISASKAESLEINDIIDGTKLLPEESTDRNPSPHDDDICTTFATVDSSSMFSSIPDDTDRLSSEFAEPNARNSEKLPAKFGDIIKVKEADKKYDSTTATGLPTNETTEDAVAGSSNSHKKSEPTASAPKLSFSGVANTLLQWKITRLRAAKRKSLSIALDAKHFALMTAISDKVKTQLPRSLLYSLREEAHPILVKTVQEYKTQLGKKHRLTIQAQQHLQKLTKDLEEPH